MSFHVGQKVVCIIDGWRERPGIVWPSKGSIYTIRELLDEGNKPSMRVFEIANPPMEFSNLSAREPAFVLWAFRPLIERKTDIAIFKRMLLPQGEDA